MVDAAGAIYVIGGTNDYNDLNPIYFNDVWASTDGGAWAGLGRGEWSVGYSRGYYRAYSGYYRGYHGGTEEY